MDDINENKFERLMAATLPENDPSTHLDVVQNFRLYIQNLGDRNERKELLDTLVTPSGDCTLRQELKEWVHMLAWDFHGELD